MHDRAAPSQRDRARPRLRRRHPEHRGLSRPADQRRERAGRLRHRARRRRLQRCACSRCGGPRASAPTWSPACRAACRASTRSAPTRGASAASPTGARPRPRATCCAAAGRAGRARRSRATTCSISPGITLSILDPPQREALIAIADRGARAGRPGRVRQQLSAGRLAGPRRRRAPRSTRCSTRVDIALPTLDDEQALFGGGRRARQCADRLHRLGVAEVAVKLGQRGLLPVLGGVHRRGAAEPVGDGGRQHRGRRQLQCRLSRGPPRSAPSPKPPARLGNRLAARVIAHPGAIIPADATRDFSV